ncbi:MAG: lamin tail domain-containing protein [Candidatus Zophobacter franzmannii]|nr:lamin tail domain-containing protein [Candidatus Zophobacter franzmannii]
MKKMILLMFLSLFMFTGALSAVTWTVSLIDSYGDGWSGGALDVIVNGTTVLTALTIETGGGPEAHTFTVVNGDEVTTDYTAGSYGSENAYYIYDHDGNEVAAEGASGTTPGDITIPIIVSASTTAPEPAINPSPADAAMNQDLDVSLTWDFGANTETYDLLFDTVNPPVAIAVTGEIAGATGTYNQPVDLTTNTVYFWRVVTKNSSREITYSSIFSFATNLGPNIVPIGAETLTGQGLPVEPYYGYTYSQSIYLQSEINRTEQRIEKIWYHYNGGTDLSATTEWVIYMGHTADAAFATNTSWVPLANLSQVYNHTLVPVPDSDTWIEFVLDVPFVYNNIDNLVIAVEDNQSSYDGSSDEFFCTADATSRSIQYQNDSSNPDPASPPSGNLKSAFPNIRMEFGAADAPVAPSLISNISPANNASSQALDVQLSWDFGDNTETYDLYFDTVNPPLLMPVDDAVVVVGAFDPGPLTESTRYYWKVVSRNAATRFETESPVYTFTTSLGANITTIGTGTLTNVGLPIEPYFVYSYSQCIYLQTEIDRTGERIEKIWYNYNQNGNLANSQNWVIYMGHTADVAFANSSSWVPLANLTEVFNGTLPTIPADGWIDFVLTTPFTYNNTDNLVIAVEENMGGCDSSSDDFFCTSDLTNRGLTYYDDALNPDPANPPAGTLVEGFANIRMELGAVTAGPEFANVIISEVNVATTVQYVELYNNSSVAQDLTNWTLNQYAPALSTPLTGTLNAGEYLVVIGGTLSQMQTEYGFAGDYIEAPATLAMEAGSWLDINDGIAKGVVDQFGSATSGAVLNVIYERTNEGAGEDLDTDWAQVLSPTPGTQNDNPILPVTLTNFAAVAMTDGMYVNLQWTVESESHMSGYNVYRSETESIDSIYQINSGIIVASNESTTHNYSFDDSEVNTGDTFNYWLESVSIDGINQFFGPVAITVTEDGGNPDTQDVQIVTAIKNIFPNPFNPSTSVTFSLKEESIVIVNVYNVKGELVSELTNEAYPEGTDHTVVWDGIDRNGKQSGSGIYFFKMETKGYTAVKKAVLIK